MNKYAFVREFGVFAGGAYAAFLQNLLMSVLFIGMLVRRGSSEGQGLTLAVNKWMGTLAPTIVFGIIGGGTFSGPSFLILVAGTFCSVFDLIYIWMLFDVARHLEPVQPQIGERYSKIRNAPDSANRLPSAH